MGWSRYRQCIDLDQVYAILSLMDNHEEMCVYYQLPPSDI